MVRPLLRPHITGRLARLVLEQVDRVTGVMPQQVVGPGSRLAESVLVLAAEEERLDDEMLQLQLPRLDPFVHPLVARVEAPCVAHHGGQPGLLLDLHQCLGVGQVVGHRDLDEAVLARPQHLRRLGGMELRRRGEDHCLDPRLCEPFGEVERPVRDPAFGGQLLGVGGVAADERDHLDPVDAGDAVEMSPADSALSGDTDLHSGPPGCPMAILSTIDAHDRQPCLCHRHRRGSPASVTQTRGNEGQTRERWEAVDRDAAQVLDGRAGHEGIDAEVGEQLGGGLHLVQAADRVGRRALDHPAEEHAVGRGELVDEVLPGLGGEAGRVGRMHGFDEQRRETLDHHAAQQLAGRRVAGLIADRLDRHPQRRHHGLEHGRPRTRRQCGRPQTASDHDRHQRDVGEVERARRRRVGQLPLDDGGTGRQVGVDRPNRDLVERLTQGRRRIHRRRERQHDVRVGNGRDAGRRSARRRRVSTRRRGRTRARPGRRRRGRRR